MTTTGEGEQPVLTKPAARRRRSRARPDEPPPAGGPENGPIPPEASPEPVTPPAESWTCVFCNDTALVDPADLKGGRFIAEPAFSIHYYVCGRCNHA